MKGMASVDAISMGKTGVVIGFSLILILTADILFNLSIEIEADARESVNPGFEYLMSIMRSTENGRPISEYILEALAENTETPYGFDLVQFFDRFQEKFELKNSEGEIIVESTPDLSGALRKSNKIIYAVPPGGILKMEFRWSR